MNHCHFISFSETLKGSFIIGLSHTHTYIHPRLSLSLSNLIHGFNRVIQNTDQRVMSVCVFLCMCAFMSRKDFCYTHKHRSCAVSVPGACDLSTIIRIDIEEEIISIFTHAFGHLGNKNTVGEDYGFGLVNQSV